MQLNTAVAMLTVQAIENPDEKEKCFQMIEILSKNSTETTQNVEEIIKNMFQTINKICKESNYAGLNSLYILETSIFDLKFMQSFGLRKFVSRKYVQDLDQNIASCEEKYLECSPYIRKRIFDKIKSNDFPRLQAYIDGMVKLNDEKDDLQRKRKQYSLEYCLNGSRHLYSLPRDFNYINDEIKPFIKKYNSLPNAIQTEAMLELNYLVNRVEEVDNMYELLIAQSTKTKSNNKNFDINEEQDELDNDYDDYDFNSLLEK